MSGRFEKEKPASCFFNVKRCSTGRKPRLLLRLIQDLLAGFCPVNDGGPAFLWTPRNPYEN
jgi:hypothetical protein